MELDWCKSQFVSERENSDKRKLARRWLSVTASGGERWWSYAAAPKPQIAHPRQMP